MPPPFALRWISKKRSLKIILQAALFLLWIKSRLLASSYQTCFSQRNAFGVLFSHPIHQQQNIPPRPPQQHQLQMLHIKRYIQKERQNRPGFPLG